MNWELKETPKVGRQLAHWIWWAALAMAVLAVLALLAWKSIRRDHNLEDKKTGQLFRSQPVQRLFSSQFDLLAGSRSIQGLNHVNNVIANRVENQFADRMDSQLPHQV